MKRSTRVALMLVVAALILGGQWLFKHAREHGTAGSAAAAPSYRLGTLRFTPCDLKQPLSGATTAAWCAPFRVPENWAAPGGRRIALRLALIRSKAAQPEPDPVVFIAGGPGQSAVDSYPQVAPALEPLLQHRNIVLLDQRGTGGSNALECPRADKAAEARAPQPGFDAAQVEADTRACLAEVEQKADPRYYTTTDAVRDLIALRKALGDPQFNLIGVSYGTRVAQQYALRDPGGVRSMVLDSVVPDTLVLGQDFARNLDAALKADFALCTGTPACAKAFGDPWAALQQLRDKLEAAPPTVSFPDPATFAPTTRALTADRLVGTVRLFAYSPVTAALLPLTIHAALAGDYAPLLGQSALIHRELGGSIDGAMELSVVCSEDAALLKPDPRDAGTLLGALFQQQLGAQCAVWPHGTMPADFHAPLKTATPVLILEGQYDPVTPPRYGEAVLKGLSDGRLLIARGQGHSVIGAGCMPRLVARFVKDLKPKTLDAQCLGALGPTPPFVNFSGATP